METTKHARACIRCRSCLSVFFVALPSMPTARGAPIVTRPAGGFGLCPNACGGKLEEMGLVAGGRLFTETEVCPCDERCTSAPGPKCSCACRGANHGTGLLVVLTSVGVVPRGEPDAKALDRAREWTAELALVEAAFTALHGDVLDRKARGEWIANFGTFLDARDARMDVQDLRKLRTHAGRMKSAAALRGRFEQRLAARTGAPA